MKNKTNIDALSLETFQSFITPQLGYMEDRYSILSNLHEWIIGEYSKTGKHYHSVEHIKHCVSAFLEFKNSVDSLVFNNSQAIFTAIYFHDIIYIAGKENNEELSAIIAEGVLTALNCKQGFIKMVKDLILITKHDKPPLTAEEKLITDIDLLALSAPWEEFLETTEKIYKEFSSLCTREVFTEGRKKFLQDLFSSRKSLYSTEYFYEKYEMRAQENLQMFLKT